MATDPDVVRRSTLLDDDEAGETVVAPKKSKKKLIVISLIVLLLLGAGGGAGWYFFMGKKSPASQDEAAEQVVEGKEAEPPVFVKLDTFTVNLQPEENEERVLQIGITLQIKEEDDLERLKIYKPQVRSRLLLLLSSKKASEITTVKGKQQLAEEIVAAVSDPFYAGAKPLSATNALFTSFIVQ